MFGSLFKVSKELKLSATLSAFKFPNYIDSYNIVNGTIYFNSYIWHRSVNKSALGSPFFKSSLIAHLAMSGVSSHPCLIRRNTNVNNY